MNIDKIKILGKVSELVSIEYFKALFEMKRVPTEYDDYIQYYKKWGEHYGVRWDLAICQSILETGRFLFKGSSVKPSNFNYAGIGATDENPRPEQFNSPEEGIKAQIQILAIRPGVKIPKEEMLSPRYVKHYDEVFGKQTYWSQLAGTWASDKKYWEKICKIANEFKVVTGIDLLEETSEEPEDPQNLLDHVNWLEFNRYDDGTPSCFGYKGELPLIEYKGKDKNKLIEFLKSCKNAASFIVADTKKIIPQPVDLEPDPIPDPDPIPNPDPIPQPDNGYYPKAIKSKYKMKTRGKYHKGSPEGLMVHYAVSGRTWGDGAIRYGRDQGYVFLSVTGDGKTYQGHHIDEWGYHAGTSKWKDWYSCSERVVGVEVNCWGKLTKRGDSYYSGSRKIPSDQVRWFGGNDLQIPGYYQIFTKEQEKALIDICMWLKARNPDVFDFDNVCGHDEVRTLAGKRGDKQDPGGSLSMSMPDFREKLKAEWAKRQGQPQPDPEPQPQEPELPTLENGDSGEAVVQLQKELNEHGYHVAIDGDFGPKTLEAVKSFQSNKGLEVDGVVGPNTWEELIKAPVKPEGLVRERLAKISEKYALGDYKESNGSYNYFRKKFFGILGSKNWPWCAAFVHKCLEEAAMRDLPITPGTGPASFALVETWQRWAEKNGYLKDPRNYTPVAGDIVLFDWSGARYPDSDWEDHIAVYLRRSGNAFVCAEGNYKNRTETVKRYLSNIQWFIHLPDNF